MEYYIGVDSGTSAFKAVLLSHAGETIASAEVAVELLKDGSKVEMSATAYRDAFFEAVRKVAAGHSEDVKAIAVSGAAGSTLYLDANGNPSPIISWTDTRTKGAKLPELEELTSDEIRQVTGWPCVDSFPLAHIAWLRENKPTELEKASWIGLCTDYLVYCLCGRHVMDLSTATTMHLVDQVQRKYHDDYIRRLGLRSDQLSELVTTGTIIAQILPETAKLCNVSPKTMVIAGSFDHPAAARGCGVHHEGEMLLSCGTSWVAFFPVNSREWIVSHKLLCDPFESHLGGSYGAMFSIACLGQTVDCYVRKLIAPEANEPYAVFNRFAEECGDTDDIIDMKAPLPANAPMPPKRLARAVMNGTAKLFADSVRKLEMPHPITKVFLAGGPAKSSVWPDIIRKYTGFNLEVTDSLTGARGAARLGMVIPS